MKLILGTNKVKHICINLCKYELVWLTLTCIKIQIKKLIFCRISWKMLFWLQFCETTIQNDNQLLWLYRPDSNQTTLIPAATVHNTSIIIRIIFDPSDSNDIVTMDSISIHSSGITIVLVQVTRHITNQCVHNCNLILLN